MGIRNRRPSPRVDPAIQSVSTSIIIDSSAAATTAILGDDFDCSSSSSSSVIHHHDYYYGPTDSSSSNSYRIASSPLPPDDVYNSLQVPIRTLGIQYFYYNPTHRRVSRLIRSSSTPLQPIDETPELQSPTGGGADADVTSPPRSPAAPGEIRRRSTVADIVVTESATVPRQIDAGTAQSQRNSTTTTTMTRRRGRNEALAVRQSAVALSASIVCWLPLAAAMTSLIQHAGDDDSHGVDEQNTDVLLLLLGSLTCALCGSAFVTPLVFIATNRHAREEIVRRLSATLQRVVSVKPCPIK